MDLLKYVLVDKSNWSDLEKLFESKGGRHNCWSMVWRNMDKGMDSSKKDDNKKSLESYVNKGLSVGLFYYLNAKIIAWCSIAPRNTTSNCQMIKRYQTFGHWSVSL